MLCDVFPNWGGPLLSIGVLCDHGCVAHFQSDTVSIMDSAGRVILTGNRDPVTRLWMVPTHSPTATCNAVLTEATGTHADIVQFYSAAMGNPTDSTLLHAITHLGLDLPGLTASMVRKCPPNSIASSKGHMNQAQHGRRSTQPKPFSDTNTTEDLYPTAVPRTSSAARVFVSQLICYSDLTGQFPIRGNSGEQYILLMSCMNYIHLETLPDRTASSHTSAYSRGHEFFTALGVVPTFERMDNENARAIKMFCDKQRPQIIQQLVPPNDHQGNKAERDIRTMKNHLIASFGSLDPSFPMTAWAHTLPQVELTLNLMRGSAFVPHVSAWHSLHGPFLFRNTPLAPLGMKVVCFESPGARSTFGPHGVDGFYVHPALQHHRCYSVYIPSTKKVRVTGQLSWHPHSVYRLPGAAPYDEVLGSIAGLRAAVLQLVQTHPNLHTDSRPLGLALPSLTQALDHLTSVFRPPAPDVPVRAAAPTLSLQMDPNPAPRVDPAPAPRVDPNPAPRVDPVPAPTPARPDTGVTRIPIGPAPSPAVVPRPLAFTAVPTHLDFTAASPATVTPLVPPGFEVPSPLPTYTTLLAPISPSPVSSPVPSPVPSPVSSPVSSSVTPPVAEPRYPFRARQPNPRYASTVQDTNWSRMTPDTFRHHVDGILQSIRASERHFATSVQQVDAFAMDANNKPLTYRTALKGPDAPFWHQAEHEEFVRLVEHTKTMVFIDPRLKPRDCVCSYYNPQVKLKIKAGKRLYRVRGTYGGNITDYAGLRSSGTADLQTVKLLLNAAVSERAQIATGDDHDFYLATDLERPEYMWVGRSQIPAATLARYGTQIVWRDDKTMVQCNKGIYGLPQAGRLAHDLAIDVLAKHGYQTRSVL